MKNIASSIELSTRWQTCQNKMAQLCPSADGLMIFSRLNIFYLTGTFVNGILWLPKEGAPILLCKKGIERVLLESNFSNVYQFRSYRDITQIFKDLSYSIPKIAAAEMNGLSWGLSQNLTKHLNEVTFIAGDMILASTRAAKSPFELSLLRKAGMAHNECLRKILPNYLSQEMTEAEVAEKCLELFFQNGHQGILRMEKFGEEIFFGHIAVGDSANYPSVYNGPVGLKGYHPAATFMGSRDIRWKVEQPLTIDNGFSYAGYQTDKTQIYWLGSPTSIPTKVQDAHDFCVEIQNFIAAKMIIGAIPSEIYQKAMDIVENSPWQEGFMGLGKNKVKFIGHGIGLAVDEYPVIARGFDEPLESGMVLAIEPKIGIKDFGMVGTENTFEITQHGATSLTGSDFDIVCIDV